MSKTSAEVKNRWNAANYDRISLFVPKGEKDRLKAEAEARGVSLNGLINEAIWQYINGAK